MNAFATPSAAPAARGAEPPQRLDRAALERLSATDPPRRPRLLSYLGRWGRARRWLPKECRVVLDVGCSFAYGTAALSGCGPSRRIVVGVEQDEAHVQAAGQRFPWLTVVEADAASLPVEDASADAITLLDVIEHTADPAAVVTELGRVLRPGGVLILSVPHRGLLTRLDSLNVYPALRRRWPSWPALDAAEGSATGTHQHFTPHELCALLSPEFVVDRVARTGLGLAELVHLTSLVFFKAILSWPRAHRALMAIHLLVYLLDDMMPWGVASYYLSVRARVVEAVH